MWLSSINGKRPVTNTVDPIAATIQKIKSATRNSTPLITIAGKIVPTTAKRFAAFECSTLHDYVSCWILCRQPQAIYKHSKISSTPLQIVVAFLRRDP